MTFEQVCQRARDAARAPYRGQADGLPEAFASLSYDGYRSLRFRPERAIWCDAALPFQIHLFHRGYLFRNNVSINLVEGDQIVPVAYRPDLFTFPPGLDPQAASHELGFAGFRIHYPLNRRDYHDEIIAFLGASYFRAIGAGQVYGASSRGLAVNMGLDTDEEFPAFEEFWIVRPARDTKAIRVYALLNSRSVTGAYQVDVQAGESTRVDVAMTLFQRSEAAKIGIAPMSSMFLRGEMAGKPADDFRPEVHDSDGLLIAAGSGEWLWRPLSSVDRPHVHSFTTSGLRGFGLLQRDRDFEHYRDREAHYDKRPSIWVEPGQGWPAGGIELLELPTKNEFADNVAACWVLQRNKLPADGLPVQYRLIFLAGDPPRHTGGKAGATGIEPLPTNGARFSIDFSGPALRRLDDDANVRAEVTLSDGRAEHVNVQKSGSDGSWRLSFDCIPISGKSVEMRAFLRVEEDTVSETWSYTWHPPRH